jgi:hypothetical protein
VSMSVTIKSEKQVPLVPLTPTDELLSPVVKFVSSSQRRVKGINKNFSFSAKENNTGGSTRNNTNGVKSVTSPFRQRLKVAQMSGGFTNSDISSLREDVDSAQTSTSRRKKLDTRHKYFKRIIKETKLASERLNLSLVQTKLHNLL